MTDGCLVRKLSQYIALTDAEKQRLTELEMAPKRYAAGTTIIDEGENTDVLYVVSEGWLFSSNMLANGARQILQLYYPGDLVGASSIAFKMATATATVGEDSILCRLPKRALGDLFRDFPRLSALFYTVGMLENVALSDRLKMLGSTSGKGKLAGFLLEMLVRMRKDAGVNLDRFELKLTQSDIGDALGMTQIHVNRLFRQLEQEENAIARYGRHIHILREDRLRSLAFFNDRIDSVDTSWFPESVD